MKRDLEKIGGKVVVKVDGQEFEALGHMEYHQSIKDKSDANDTLDISVKFPWESTPLERDYIVQEMKGYLSWLMDKLSHNNIELTMTAVEIPDEQS